jgi:hypothetical protein
MRDAVPRSFRIAAGSLLAVLLSGVGCYLLWRNPASPEALLKRADEMSSLPTSGITVQAETAILEGSLCACQRIASTQRIRNERSSSNRVAQR